MCVPENYYSWIDKDLKGLIMTGNGLKQGPLKRKSSFLMDTYIYVDRQEIV